jgi:hypothetical protein
MLFWMWFLVAVLLGIDLGAEILGVGPQAYVGGLLTGAAFIWASKSWPDRRSAEGEMDPSRGGRTGPLDAAAGSGGISRCRRSSCSKISRYRNGGLSP